MVKVWIRRKDGILQRYNLKSRTGYFKTDQKARTGAIVWSRQPEARMVWRISYISNKATRSGSRTISAQYRVWQWLDHEPTLSDKQTLKFAYLDLETKYPPLSFDMPQPAYEESQIDENEMQQPFGQLSGTWELYGELVAGNWAKVKSLPVPQKDVVYGYIHYGR